MGDYRGGIREYFRESKVFQWTQEGSVYESVKVTDKGWFQLKF